MRQYKIFKHPSGAMEAVKQGWSWPGAFFGFFWALVKKLWMVALVTIGAILVFNALILTPEVNSLGWLILFIVFGVNGNKWRENNLLSTGYQADGYMVATNSGTAIAQHIMITARMTMKS